MGAAASAKRDRKTLEREAGLDAKHEDGRINGVGHSTVPPLPPLSAGRNDVVAVRHRAVDKIVLFPPLPTRSAVMFVDIPFKAYFQVLKTLGSGTYGEVKLVAQKKSGNQYAAKVMYKPGSPLHLATDFEVNEIRNEVRVMQHLHFAQLVELYAAYEEYDRFTLLLELCQGGNLAAYLEDLSKQHYDPTHASSLLLPSANASFATSKGGPNSGTPTFTIESGKSATPSQPIGSDDEGITATSSSKSSAKPPLSSSNISASNYLTLKNGKFPIRWERRPSSTGLEPIAEWEAAAIMCDLLAGLGYVHARGYLHRDVKLGNIFLRRVQRKDTSLIGNDYVLGDFGFSCHLRRGQLCHKYCGSPNYMAPEVVGNKGASTKTESTAMGVRTYNASCDIWSAGVVLYVMISGEFPFYGSSAKDTLRQIIHNDVKYHHPAFSTCSTECLACVKSMLCKNSLLRPTAMNLLRTSPWLQRWVPSRVQERCDSLGVDVIEAKEGAQLCSV